MNAVVSPLPLPNQSRSLNMPENRIVAKFYTEPGLPDTVAVVEGEGEIKQMGNRKAHRLFFNYAATAKYSLYIQEFDADGKPFVGMFFWEEEE